MRVAGIRTGRKLNVLGKRVVDFSNDDLVLNKATFLPYHSNGMEFTAFDATGAVLAKERFYSIGGGFFVDDRCVLFIPRLRP